MKAKLRHPIRAIREPFGTAGLVVACIALVLALTGAAFAAGALTGKQKKEVEKIAKKFAGKPGAPGATGPAGPAGPAGAAGKEGPQGKQGETGQSGSNGKSVVTGTPTGLQCPEGGVTVEVEGSGTKTPVCNGLEGLEGPAGSPWTAGGTLPSGQTESGEFAALEYVPGGGPAEGFVKRAVSFGIPLEAAPAAHFITTEGKERIFKEEPAGSSTFVEEEVVQPACPGTAQAPDAEPGSLCVYAITESNSDKSFLGRLALPKVCALIAHDGGCTGSPPSADEFGFGVETIAESAGYVSVIGSWAVTAP